MINRQKSHLQEVQWQDIRKKVQTVNPDLASVIDAFDPPPEYTFFIARYSYGSYIVKDNCLQVANAQGDLVPLTDNSIAKTTQKKLHCHAGMPVGVMLSKSIELFQAHEGKDLSFSLYTPGKVFGLWRSLDNDPSYHSSPLWNITAGARSIFMLPKLTDSNSHRKLKQAFGIKTPPPKQLDEQWPIFTAISQHPDFPQPWHSELLYFSEKWLQPQLENPRWLRFHHYLLNTAWQNTAFWRNQFFWDYIFSCIQANRNLKPNPYLADTTKHLFTIGIGASPGFAVAKDDIGAPITGLQQVYLDIYGLKNYAPTLMHLCSFDMYHADAPVYYSLQLPTTYEFSPKSRSLTSTMADLREIKHILQSSISELKADQLKLQNHPMQQLANLVEFDFFHSEDDKYGEIRPTNDIFSEDPRLVAQQKQYPERGFSDNSPILRGCIRIARRKK